MTIHPCKGMSKRQIEVFEQIGAGTACPSAAQSIFETLLNKQLIYRGPDKVLNEDRFGRVALPQYYVPIPVHMQWCEWCSEHFEEPK